MAQTTTPLHDPRVELLRDTFFNRVDVAAILAPWGKPQPVQLHDNLDALLLAHLHGSRAPGVKICYRTRRGMRHEAGRYRIGAYTPAPGGKTKWLCIDLDGAGHAAGLADPNAVARHVVARFQAKQVPVYLERSGGGQGWHVWCFFEESIYAARARRLALCCVPADAHLRSGERAEPAANRGIEIFPKQTRPMPQGKGLGNLVWLPWWSGAPDGANQFYSINPEGEFVPATIDRLEVATARRLQHVIPMKEEMASERNRQNQPANQCGSSLAVSGKASSASSVWKTWREKALAELDLKTVYGDWLTEKTLNDGWLEARDPDSKTGDRSPSASVADGSGIAERGAFHSFLSKETESVFDFLIRRKKARDFREAQRLVAKLSGVPLPSPATGGSSVQEEGPLCNGTNISPPRPVIQASKRQLDAICRDGVDALLSWNQRDDGSGKPPPYLFNRSGQLVCITHKGGSPTLEPLTENAIYGLLARCADWIKVSNEGRVPCSPVRDVARDMLAFPSSRLPRIESVATSPLFARDGRLIAQHGYDREEGLWLELPRSLRQLVKANPRGELARSRSLLLEDLLGDFPFVSPSDRAHAVAAILLPFVRRMIDGPSPLHLIEAPTPGSGKGLLASVISVIAQGTPAEARSLSPQEEEARKMLTAELARGRTLILLDNISEHRRLDSPVLAAILTTRVWCDRLLTRSEMLDLPNLALWLLTANNPTVSMEIARRCVRVRIDASVSRPWLRDGFHHKDLIGWAMAQRPQLVQACIALVLHWIEAGRKPAPGKRLGSFESWSEVIGGILAAAGIDGFLESLDELYEEADDETDLWQAFVETWWRVHGSSDVPVGTLVGLCLAKELMPQVIDDRTAGSPRSAAIRLGKALAQARDRVFDGLRLIRVGRRSHREKVAYRLEPGWAKEPPRKGGIPPRTDSGAESRSRAEGSSGPCGHSRGSGPGRLCPL